MLPSHPARRHNLSNDIGTVMAAQRSQAIAPLEERTVSNWLVVTRRLHTEVTLATTGKNSPFTEILFPRKFQDIHFHEVLFFFLKSQIL